MKSDNSKIDPKLIPTSNELKLKENQKLISVPYTFLGLVDRSKTKDKWRTSNPDKLMLFINKEIANNKCRNLKFGFPVVVEYDKAVHKLTHWFWKIKENDSLLDELLKERLSIWHDDD